jgi:hypothetical protein
MGSRPIGSGGRRVYMLDGIYDYVLQRQRKLADQPDPRVNLADEGPARDRLIDEDRFKCVTDPAFRRGKCTLPIERLEAGLPVLLPRRSIDCRPIHPSEPPGRQSWPEAKQWPEIRDRSVQSFELHSDDTLVPVTGDADPATYWG